MTRSITPEEEQEIVRLYLEEGLGAPTIASRVGRGTTSVQRVLERNHVDMRSLRRFSDAEELGIVRQYLEENWGAPALAAAYDCDHSTIYDILRRHGAETRDWSDYRSYALDEAWFDQVDTPEKAYFLGLLYADGTQDGRVVQITLQPGDRELLERISALFQPTKPLYDINGYVRLEIASRRVCERLAACGVTQRKTWSVVWPESLEPSLSRHFIRGVFDGDGGLAYTVKTKTYLFQITGTEALCCSILEVLRRETGVGGSITNHPSPGIANVSIGGHQQLEKLYYWLYDGALIYLERKYQKWQEFLAARKKTGRYARLDADQVRYIKYELLPTRIPQRQIGDLFGVTEACIQKIATGKTWGYI